MSFIGALRGGREVQASYLPWDDYWYEPVSAPTATGVSVSRTKALRIPAVLQAVRLISEAIAGLPVGVFAKPDGEMPIQRPSPTWLERPNPECETRFELIQQWVTGLLIDCNAYSLMFRDRRGVVGEVWPQSWDKVTVERDRTTRTLRYHIDGTEYGPKDVLHIRGFTLPGEAQGRSAVDLCAESLGLALAAEEYAGRWFSQGSMGTHLLTSAGGDAEQAEALEKKINDRWAGLTNAWKIKVLGKAADAKLHTLSVPNDQSQMLETRVHQVIEVARIMNVPPHLLYEMTKETTWGSGIEQQGIGFVTYTLTPHMVRLEQKIKTLLGKGEYPKWNVKGLLRGDTFTRFQAHEIALRNGWMNVDEIRALEEMPPLPNNGGQWYIRNSPEWRPEL